MNAIMGLFAPRVSYFECSDTGVGFRRVLNALLLD